jgi:hypothetical protein
VQGQQKKQTKKEFEGTVNYLKKANKTKPFLIITLFYKHYPSSTGWVLKQLSLG